MAARPRMPIAIAGPAAEAWSEEAVPIDSCAAGWRTLRRVEELLAAWYGQNARDLPWRHTADPYAILVSEVMAQQTQVERVVPRYVAWLERWPTAEALAAASS